MQTPDGDRGGQESTGLSRRGLIKGAAGVGAVAATAGFLGSALAEPGSANAATTPPTGAMPAGPVVAHVRDMRTGDVDLFVGTRQIRVRDTELAARLARAASS